MTVYGVFWYDPGDSDYPEILMDIWSTLENAETRAKQLRESHSINTHEFIVRKLLVQKLKID